MRGVLLACWCVFAALMAEARPFAVVRETGSCVTEANRLSVDAAWDLEVPVWVQGLDDLQTAKLRQTIYADVFEYDDPKPGMLMAAPSDSMQALITQKLIDVARNPGAITAGALDLRANVRLAFVGKKWLGYMYEGYYNEGGCGCHARVAFRVLSVPELQQMTPETFLLPGKTAEFTAWLAGRVRKERGIEAEPELPPSRPLEDFMPSTEGVAFRFRPYSIFCGATGIVGCLIPWDELVPWCKPEALAELKALVGK